MAIVLDQAEKSAPVVGEVRILLSDIRWEFYLTFCEEIGERPIRLSYSEGLLEIMITHSPHEFYKTMLAKLIETVILECNLPVRSGGAMTFQRHDLERDSSRTNAGGSNTRQRSAAKRSLTSSKTRPRIWPSKSR